MSYVPYGLDNWGLSYREKEEREAANQVAAYLDLGLEQFTVLETWIKAIVNNAKDDLEDRIDQRGVYDPDW